MCYQECKNMPFGIFYIFLIPYSSLTLLPRTNQSSRFSCNVIPSKKPFSPHSEVYLFLCSLISYVSLLWSYHMHGTYFAGPSLPEVLVSKAQRSQESLHCILSSGFSWDSNTSSVIYSCVAEQAIYVL